jgi:hypothetical protein
MSRDELEQYHERLRVVTGHFVGTASIAARPAPLPAPPRSAPVTTVEVKEVCEASFRAALSLIPTQTLESFFNFVRRDIQALNSTGQPLSLPRLPAGARDAQAARTRPCNRGRA